MKPLVPNPLLNVLGYEVLTESEGVYHLRLQGSRREFIAILFAERPLTGVAAEVKFLSFELADGVPPEAVRQHWKTLDARRLEASGVLAQPVRLSANYLPPGYTPGSGLTIHQRPLNMGERGTVVLATGEVVCYN